MYNLLYFEELTRPINNPVLKFLIIMAIILFAPLLFNKIRIPHILGIIIAGAIIGPFGLNLVERDSGILLSGTAGLLYIMFLAGLEIDFNEFKRNSGKSIIFGLFSFVIPMGLGIATGYYILEYNMLASILLGSIFASHTLITYPLVSKMGVKSNRAVTITIGGTVIADTLALLVLAGIVGLSEGEAGTDFWVRLISSIMLFSGVVLFGFPIVARLFFKRVTDGLSQYVFVLLMLFLGASLAELAGIESIVGAFFVGLALNRQIPHSSALMNRIEFIGNAIFIPFFLIGVGMLIDYRAFISDWNTVYVAVVMTVIATISKFAAAYLTQKSFGFSSNERTVIFGLSNARVAAALAAVLVGHEIIIGYTPAGDVIRLVNDSVLNGAIVMIFFTCTIASFSAQRGAARLALEQGVDIDEQSDDNSLTKILLPIHREQTTDELVNFANLITTRSSNSFVTVASIVDVEKDERAQVDNSKKIFEKAIHAASAADRVIETSLRYDTSYTVGIQNLIREQGVTDLLLDVDKDSFVKDKFLSKFADQNLISGGVTTFLYRSCQPIQTVKRYVLVLPPNAELEIGFRSWVVKIWNLFRATGASVVVYTNSQGAKVVSALNKAVPVPLQINDFERYQDLLIISKELRTDDALIFVLSKRQNVSYEEGMESVPYYINTYFSDVNFVMIYPQMRVDFNESHDDLMNPTSAGAVSRIEDIVNGITGLLQKKS